MKFLAPAKVNLALRVTGRRADGYHLLESIMVFFPWYDTLEIDPIPDADPLHRITLESTPAVTVLPEENLVWRAAHLLATNHPVTLGARIRLSKSIPDGAGLGGGSSDAALTLLALNRLWGLNLSLERLIELGTGLGADIPFFLGGRSALVQGIGERLSGLTNPPTGALVVIYPGAPLVTKRVFQALAGRYPVRDAPLGMPDSEVDPASWMENDLELPAVELCPVIPEARAALLAVGARVARMSGSGSTTFGLFPDEQAASEAAARLALSHPGWRVCSGPILHAHPFLNH